MIKKYIAILGAGMLGKYLNEYFSQLDNNEYFVKLYSHAALDITDNNAIKQIINEYDYIINCAAYTNVDKAENELDKCYLVNAEAVKNLAILCAKFNKHLIHISTDFVYGRRIS